MRTLLNASIGGRSLAEEVGDSKIVELEDRIKDARRRDVREAYDDEKMKVEQETQDFINSLPRSADGRVDFSKPIALSSLPPQIQTNVRNFLDRESFDVGLALGVDPTVRVLNGENVDIGSVIRAISQVSPQAANVVANNIQNFQQHLKNSQYIQTDTDTLLRLTQMLRDPAVTPTAAYSQIDSALVQGKLSQKDYDDFVQRVGRLSNVRETFANFNEAFGKSLITSVFRNPANQTLDQLSGKVVPNPRIEAQVQADLDAIASQYELRKARNEDPRQLEQWSEREIEKLRQRYGGYTPEMWQTKGDEITALSEFRRATDGGTSFVAANDYGLFAWADGKVKLRAGSQTIDPPSPVRFFQYPPTRGAVDPFSKAGREVRLKVFAGLGIVDPADQEAFLAQQIMLTGDDALIKRTLGALKPKEQTK